MKLVEFYQVDEGANDSVQREAAYQYANLILDQIFDNPVRLKFVQRTSVHYSPALVATNEAFSRIFEDLTVQFQFVGRDEKFAEAQITSNGKKSILTIALALDATAFAVLDTGGEFTAREMFAENEDVVRGKVDALAHELIHHFDRLKMGWDRWKKQNTDQNKKLQKHDHDSLGYEVSYLNQPIEMNAYFQQVAGLVAREVRQDPNLLSDVNSFYEYFLKRGDEIVPGTFDKWRQRNMPHLKKRVAQLYQDLKKAG
jgi:hypothetical protein